MMCLVPKKIEGRNRKGMSTSKNSFFPKFGTQKGKERMK